MHLAMALAMAFALGSLPAAAQVDRRLVGEGNREYRKGNFTGAETLYRKAQEANPSNAQAAYNLGCALMMQQKDSAAVVQYERAAKMPTSRRRLSMAYHNIGVICQNSGLYGEAIEAYEQALRNNPQDDETRYNLALCKWLRKNEPDQGGGQQQQQQGDGDDDSRDKEKENKPNDSGDERQQQQEGMSRENAEQVLNAAVQQEKNTQERMQNAMQQHGSRQLERNW